jgi:hypothetical protein
METEEFQDKPEKEADPDAENELADELDSAGGDEEVSEQTGAEEGGGY